MSSESIQRDALEESNLIVAPTWGILTRFFSATQAPPHGVRPAEALAQEEQDEENDAEDDRVRVKKCSVFSKTSGAP